MFIYFLWGNIHCMYFMAILLLFISCHVTISEPYVSHRKGGTMHTALSSLEEGGGIKCLKYNHMGVSKIYGPRVSNVLATPLP